MFSDATPETPAHSGESKSSTTIKSINSFKVLTECPIIVVLLFQLYSKYSQHNIPKFMPLIMKALSLQAPSGSAQKFKSAYVDFIASQVKTLSFLAYLLRGFTEHLRPYQENIPKYTVQLLHNCPSDSVPIRKELMIATRHILATEFRVGFVSYVDALLDEKVLLGTGYTSQETLRPLAFSTLVDLVPSVRNNLTIPQITRIVIVYTKNIHDPTLPYTIQTMCTKLLITLVECIVRKNEVNPDGRTLLIRMLDSFVNKFSNLKKQEYVQSSLKPNSTEIKSQKGDTIKEFRFLVRSLIIGTKNVIWSLNSCAPYRAPSPNSAAKPEAKPFSPTEDAFIYTQLLKNGLKCLTGYTSISGSSVQEDKEALDNFAQIFTFVEARIFKDIFSHHLPLLFKCILENQALFLIPQQLLGSTSTSKAFLDILMSFLIERIDKLGGEDKSESNVLTRLFKFAFSSLTIFPDNEQVLLPHITTIITASIRQSSLVPEPYNYFGILRSLFHSLVGGRFELLYMELLPLLPDILKWLTKLYESNHPSHLKDIFIDLCLTMPVRLSSLIPHLDLLMKPLVIALSSSNQDLVSQGLRTVELLIDSLNLDFLDSFDQNINYKLMSSLWKLLRSSPSNNSQQVVRILGKLGGRNNSFVLTPVIKSDLIVESENILSSPTIDSIDTTLVDAGFKVSFTFQPNEKCSIPLGKSIFLSARQLQYGATEIKKSAFEFLKSCLLLRLAHNNSTEKISELEISNISTFSIENRVRNSKTNDALTPAYVDIENNITETLLQSIIIAASVESLEVEAKILVENLTKYFALIYVKYKVDRIPLHVHNPMIFIDTLVSILAHENRSYSATCQSIIESLWKNTCILTQSELQASKLSCYSHLLSKLCQSCYNQSWESKQGGWQGIDKLISLLPKEWVCENFNSIASTLLFILEDLSPEICLDLLKNCEKSFISVVTLVAENFFISEKVQQHNAELVKFVKLLTNELISPYSIIRKNVREAFQIISDNSKQKMPDLLESDYDKITEIIFSKQFKSVPVTQQIGFIEGLNFVISKTDFINCSNAPILNILQEALTVADAEELPPKHHQLQQQTSELRASCITFLSNTISKNELRGPEHQELRNRIIGVFFKALTYRSKEVVEAAKTGIEDVIEQYKLAKDLLQSSLRPILLNLTSHRRLTVPLLEGLARLLVILTNCFNVTLGKKLLEHLVKLKDSIKANTQRDSEEIKVTSTIISVFHLLPPAAAKFLDQLVPTTIDLEAINNSEVYSPYRVPLTLFLNRYPEISVKYFFDRISQRQYIKLFQYIIKDPIAIPLREEISENPDKLVSLCLMNENKDPDLVFQGIQIAHTISKFLPNWLDQKKQVLLALSEVWKSSSFIQHIGGEDLNSPLYFLRESKLLTKCFLIFCKHSDSTEVIETLFQMLSIFSYRTAIDYSFLREFYATEVAEKYSATKKVAILKYFLTFFRDPGFRLLHKVQALQMLVLPVLTNTLKSDETIELLESNSVIASLIGTIIESFEGPQTYPKEEALNIELLKLATLLVQYIPTKVVHHRKELIKFAWNHLKSEDTTTKHCSYVLVCRFIEAYETPPKIVLQVFVPLLRAHQSEAKHLVKEALDILMPTLNARLSESNTGAFPTWTHCTRKIIIEDGHSLPQLIHVMHLLVRHPKLFYPTRAQFIPQIVSSLARIGALQSTILENRKLAIDLVELIINWEKTAIQKSQEVEMKDSETTIEEASSEQQVVKKIPSNAHIDAIFAFLIRIGGAEATEMTQRAVDLLKEALVVWKTVPVKLLLFEKLLSAESNQQIAGLNLLNLVLEHQIHMIIPDNISQLQQLILQEMNSDNITITNLLCESLQKIINYFPPTKSTQPNISFYTFITEIIESGLVNHEKGKCHSSIVILKTLCSSYPELLEPYVPTLVKLLQKLAKDHCSPNTVAVTRTEPDNNAETQPPATSQSNLLRLKKEAATGLQSKASEASLDITESIKLCIQLINTRIGNLGENKRSFYHVLTTLIEKSKDVELLISITTMIRNWIIGTDAKGSKSSSTITSKERTTFLLKMTRFEQISSPQLHSTYFELVLQVYNDPDSSKTEMSQLEPGFMMGLRSKEPAIRENFFEIFHNTIMKSLHPRLNYILAVQNWESLGNTFWIKQALDLLLAIIIPEKRPVLCVSPFFPPLGASSQDQVMEDDDEMVDVISSNNNEGRSAVFNEITQFFQEKLSNIAAKDIILTLKNLMHKNNEFAFHLWTTIFPRLWTTLPKSEQQKLTRPFILLTAKEYHAKQKSFSPNVVQSLIEGAAKTTFFDNPMQIPSQLLKFIGKTYNSWYPCIHLIDQVLINQNGVDEVTHESLAELYELLNEEDLYFGVLRHTPVSDNTRIGLLLEQFGMWQWSQEVYLNLMTQAQASGTVQSKSEKLIWEEHWLKCSKRLSQWDPLTDFAKTYNRTDLLLDNAWKVSDWAALKEAATNNKQIFNDSPFKKIVQGYLLIHEKSPEIEAHCVNLIQSLLAHWNSLPMATSCTHIPLLQSFQKVVELHESTQIIESINAARSHQALHELKLVLQTWRERLPNKWDDISLWADILLWRQHIFGLINTAFHPLVKVSTTLAYIGHHETAWCINKFSHIARKHQLVEVCLNSLSKIYTLPDIEIRDAFVKLREQVKCYFSLKPYYHTGLEIINSTNLEYFGAQQKAEFFQLKGEFLSKMGKQEEANNAFSAAISMYESLARAWVSWGEFCDRQFFIDTKKSSWIENTINCYLQAVRCKSKKMRKKLARVLWLLTFFDIDKVISKSIERFMEALPIWIWLEFIPQLLNSLQLNEAPIVSTILVKIAENYPQAIYYPLRSFNVSRESSSSSSMEFSSPPPPPAPDHTALLKSPWEYIDQIRNQLKISYSNLTQHDILIDEICKSLTPRPYEIVLEYLQNVMQNCNKRMINIALLQQQIQNLHQQSYFTEISFDPFDDSNHSIEVTFENDFLRSEYYLIDDLVHRLGKWIKFFESKVESLPKILSLSTLSTILLHINSILSPIEIPGLYQPGKEPIKDLHVHLQRFHPKVIVRSQSGFAQRIFNVRGSDGKYISMALNQSLNSYSIFAEERMSQLLKVYNSSFLEYKETRRKGISLNTPSIVSITSNVRLLFNFPVNCVSYEQLWINYCAEKKMDPSFPLTFYYKQLKGVRFFYFILFFYFFIFLLTN